ncbi:uncharacterized protein DS421_18g628510 [Arachis hypogaea]|nr:uncharacterized protein DS421_18g628510 [Arachis hypogaea]
MHKFFEHTHTRKEDRTQWVDEHSRKTKAAIEAGVTDLPPVSEESIWIETVGEKRRGRVYGMSEDLNTSNSQMDQFSHQLSSLTEYVRVMGPSSSGSRVLPPPPFTFPSSQKSTAPGRKLPPILQPQTSQMDDDSDDLDDSDDYLDEYE